MKTALHKVLNAATDKPLFFAYQNGNELPPEPYKTIYVISADTSKPVHRSILDADGNRIIESHRQALVQLDCYGLNSYRLLDIMAQTLETEAVLTLCDSLNVSISDYNGVKQVPIPIDKTSYQDRSTLTFKYNYITAVDEVLPIIDSAIPTGEYTNG